MGFSRQECWSRLPFLSPGDLPDPGIEARSPTLQADALPSEPPGKPDLPLEKPVCRSGATVRTGHGTTDWFQTGKRVRQGCILSPCLFNFYAEYIMRNAELEEAQAGILIAGRNTNNLRYADDTTLMAESEELETLDESEREE